MSVFFGTIIGAIIGVVIAICIAVLGFFGIFVDDSTNPMAAQPAMEQNAAPADSTPTTYLIAPAQ